MIIKGIIYSRRQVCIIAFLGNFSLDNFVKSPNKNNCHERELAYPSIGTKVNELENVRSFFRYSAPINVTLMLFFDRKPNRPKIYLIDPPWIGNEGSAG
jgi:hypothetical protein